MTFDLSNGFPLLTSKKIGWKTVLRELLWFIKGSTNNKELQGKNVHIWDGNASKEYLQTRGLDYEEGDLGPIYGFQWRNFGGECHGISGENGRGVDQIKYMIDLIQNDPSSRRIIGDPHGIHPILIKWHYPHVIFYSKSMLMEIISMVNYINSRVICFSEYHSI